MGVTRLGDRATLHVIDGGDHSEIWDGQGENPFFGILGLADSLIVTGDSVNMVSEAASTGKPVHVVDLKGGSGKFTRFHRSLRNAGITRPFAGTLERWDYEPLAETHRIAAEIRRRLGDRHHRTAGDLAQAGGSEFTGT